MKSLSLGWMSKIYILLIVKVKKKSLRHFKEYKISSFTTGILCFPSNMFTLIINSKISILELRIKKLWSFLTNQFHATFLQTSLLSLSTVIDSFLSKISFLFRYF